MNNQKRYLAPTVLNLCRLAVTVAAGFVAIRVDPLRGANVTGKERSHDSVTCPECEESLTGRRGTAVYCSSKCRQRAYRSRFAAATVARTLHAKGQTLACIAAHLTSRGFVVDAIGVERLIVHGPRGNLGAWL